MIMSVVVQAPGLILAAPVLKTVHLSPFVLELDSRAFCLQGFFSGPSDLFPLLFLVCFFKRVSLGTYMPVRTTTTISGTASTAFL